MTKKVLVLCQRKSGTHYGTNIEHEVVPKIKAMAEQIMHTKDFSIEFLSDQAGHEEGEVDIKGTLKSGTDFSSQFLSKTKAEGKYDLIVLNTCPFQFMDYKLIHQLLKKDAIMVFAAYPRDIYQVTMVAKKSQPPQPPANLFADVANDAFIMYKRIGAGTGKRKRTSSGGTGTGKRKRKSKRKNKHTKKRTRRTRR
jgi:hypothetical protein